MNPIDETQNAIVKRVASDAAAWAVKRKGPAAPMTGMHVAIIVAYVAHCDLGADLHLACIAEACDELLSMSAPKLETLSPLFGEAKPTC